MIRAAAFGVLALFLAALVLVAAKSSDGADEPVQTVGGRDVFRWRQIALQKDETARRQAATIRRLRRTLRHDGTIIEAINLASITYGVSGSLMFHLARCESHLNPRAKNRSSSASGLFQFLPSTFASTPYRRLSIWSPYANALAAAHMIARGRRGEWVC